MCFTTYLSYLYHSKLQPNYQLLLLFWFFLYYTPLKMPRKKSATKKAREATTKDLNEKQKQLPQDNGKSQLIDDNSSEEEDNSDSFKINEDFAKRFEHNKKREETQRLEEKYGKDLAKQNLSEDEDESSEESEDSEGELVTPEVDAAILKILAKIRKKDPEIYDNGQRFFDDTEKSIKTTVKENKGRPMTLKDYHRQQLISGDVMEAMEEDEKPRSELPTHVEEQEQLRKETIQAFHSSRDKEEENPDEHQEEEEKEEENFLKKKEKSKDELEADEKAYEKFLLEHAETEDASKVLKDLSTSYVKNRPEVLQGLENEENGFAEQDETFLANYMLNRGWRTSDKRIPSYEEIVQEVDADNQFDETADNFETKYNFRYEEAGGAEIAAHPRDVPDSMRRKDDSRRLARERKRERREEEKRKRVEEVNRLRNLKQKDLEEKLNKVAEIAGTNDIDISELDLEGDFNPEEWEAKMAQIFNDKYYKDDSDKKPEFEDDIDVDDLAAPEDNNDSQVNGNVADLPSDPEAVDEPGSQKKTKRQSRKEAKNKKRKIEEYVDEKYGVPEPVASSGSQFRYRQVAPETFGMDVLDILNASDSDLNKYVGLKKLMPYRTPDQIEKDKKKFGKKKRLREWKKEVFGKRG
ncbi:krr family protein [Schizosaccharomyces cryophilus OY26]|uniref:Krr family protein n=1 Tax=Schizosaccharomyces cryophilus (strain OY26 / ATCC MYA-4695 / CBS 11777 / NBRC 106824 / NRRL Y48691) TaxID=653667 RepID=S9W214_SCHCR|nr:krr family protein [Schizosaccharomyces cryophilus OY26]EPY54088.1 krr family protein [Schizosaccharomyces cryophilus OY26]